MKTYYIDFKGDCKIKARNADEAEEKFWRSLQRPCAACYDDVYDIIDITDEEERRTQMTFHNKEILITKPHQFIGVIKDKLFHSDSIFDMEQFFAENNQYDIGVAECLFNGVNINKLMLADDDQLIEMRNTIRKENLNFVMDFYREKLQEEADFIIRCDLEEDDDSDFIIECDSENDDCDFPDGYDIEQWIDEGLL